jgi:hypothetical protein
LKKNLAADGNIANYKRQITCVLQTLEVHTKKLTEGCAEVARIIERLQELWRGGGEAYNIVRPVYYLIYLKTVPKPRSLGPLILPQKPGLSGRENYVEVVPKMGDSVAAAG